MDMLIDNATNHINDDGTQMMDLDQVRSRTAIGDCTHMEQTAYTPASTSERQLSLSGIQVAIHNTRTTRSEVSLPVAATKAHPLSSAIESRNRSVIIPTYITSNLGISHLLSDAEMHGAVPNAGKCSEVPLSPAQAGFRRCAARLQGQFCPDKTERNDDEPDFGHRRWW